MPANREMGYEQLIAPVEEQMMGVIWRIVRDSADFDDAFQEATIKIWRQLRKIRRHPNPHALVLRICINAAYDILRKKTRRRKREVLGHIPEDVASQAPGPGGAEERGRILDAIARLPRRQAQSALLRFVEGLSYREIGQTIGCSEVTARTHTTRARKKLRRQLADLAHC